MSFSQLFLPPISNICVRCIFYYNRHLKVTFPPYYFDSPSYLYNSYVLKEENGKLCVHKKKKKIWYYSFWHFMISNNIFFKFFFALLVTYYFPLTIYYTVFMLLNCLFLCMNCVSLVMLPSASITLNDNKISKNKEIFLCFAFLFIFIQL